MTHRDVVAVGAPAGGVEALRALAAGLPDNLPAAVLVVPRHPAGYGCPSCGGALYEVENVPVPRYQCRVGHAWSPESLLDEQSIELESALWLALRALKEKAALDRRMATATTRSFTGGDRFHAMAADAEAAQSLLRQLIDRIGAAPDRGNGGTANDTGGPSRAGPGGESALGGRDSGPTGDGAWG